MFDETTNTPDAEVTAFEVDPADVEALEAFRPSVSKKTKKNVSKTSKVPKAPKAKKNTNESKRSKGTTRMEGILLSRIASFNKKGKGFQISEGYYPTWKVAAKRLAVEGKIEQRGAYWFMKNAVETPAEVAP